MPKPGEQTREAIFAQPEWLRAVPERVGERRFPEGHVLFTGCGTSFHAAQVGAELAGGEAVQALELVLRPRQADVLEEAAANLAAVGDAHANARGDGVPIGEKGQHGAPQA